MALIACPECGKRVSNLATACPSCGFPFAVKPDGSETRSESSDRPEVQGLSPLKEVEKQAFIEALKRCGGNAKRVAELLEISRTGLYYKLDRFNIDINDYEKRGISRSD